MPHLRVKFSRGEAVKFISHLDVMRLWARALRRAQVPLAYSAGFNPQPRLSLAAPLPVGVTSEAELMDVFIIKLVSPLWFITTVNGQLPPGVVILEVYPTALNTPSLSSQVRYAEYRVELVTEKEARDIDLTISNLLTMEHLPWQHQRDTGWRNYDLRALIDNLWLIDWRHPWCTVGMRLRCDSRGAGRPEQVTLALGFTHYPQSMHRTKLILEN